MPTMAPSLLTVPSGAVMQSPASLLGAGVGLNRMVTAAGAAEPTRTPLPVSHEDCDGSAAESSSSSATETEASSNSFRPIYVMGKDHDIRVVADGSALEVTVVWPKAMTDVVYLHKFWLAKEPGFLPNHPRLISFRAFLRRFRNNNRQEIHSTFRLKLPFKVKTELTVTKRNTSYLS
eukprot:IDg4052t1